MLSGSLTIASTALTIAVSSYAPQTTAAPAALASGEHESGVRVELVSITRDSPAVVTVRWRYRNDTAESKRLTKQRTGGIDPYRLSLDTYLLDEARKIKFPVSRDTDNHPVASRNGVPNGYIDIKPHTTIEAWGKYFVPDTTSTVTVAIDGVAPFSGIAVPK